MGPPALGSPSATAGRGRLYLPILLRLGCSVICSPLPFLEEAAGSASCTASRSVVHRLQRRE
eukprot:8780882-Alexandrium_andersonii.AAC.1